MENWTNLLVTSVLNPSEAARRVLALNLPREALWTAIVLVSVLNTFVFTFSNMLLPVPLPASLTTPALYFFLSAGSLIIAIIVLFWAGRALGGRGRMTDVMSVVVWLQVLRLAVQVASFILVLALPALAGLLMIASALVGLWIMLHFVNEAHRFESLMRAGGVLIVAFLSMVLGLSVLLSIIGVSVV